MRRSAILLAALTLSIGCGNGGTPVTDTGNVVDSGQVVDTGTVVDTGGMQDVTGSDVAPTDTSMDDTMAIDGAVDAATDATATDAPPVRDVQLRPHPGMIFCFTGPDGGTQTCSGASAICCDSRVDGGFVDNCVANLAACPAPAKAVQCLEASDCMTGQICCGQTGVSSRGTPFLDHTACAASCAAPTMTQICTVDTECTGGTHCVAQHVSGRDLGYCM